MHVHFLRLSVEFRGAHFASSYLRTPLSCIQPNKAKIAQSIRVDWDLPVPPQSPSESIIDRFNLLTSPALSLYNGFKFNVPLNSAIFASLNCSGPGFPTGVDDTGTDIAKTSNSRSDCLSHLNDADISTRTFLSLSSSTTTDQIGSQLMAMPSSEMRVAAEQPLLF